jgi:hypothetical protein
MDHFTLWKLSGNESCPRKKKACFLQMDNSQHLHVGFISQLPSSYVVESLPPAPQRTKGERTKEPGVWGRRRLEWLLGHSPQCSLGLEEARLLPPQAVCCDSC